MQTREDRIYRHFEAIHGRAHAWDNSDWVSMGASVWMPLARHWKMSIRELKEIVAREKERRAN